MLDQRLRRWAGVVQMFCVYWECTEDFPHHRYKFDQIRIFS